VAIEGRHPERPIVSKGFVTPQLMVNPREHLTQLIGLHQPQDIPHTIGTGFDLPDQRLYPLGLPDLLFHRIEASVAHHKQEQDTSPKSGGGNPGALPSISKRVDLFAEVEDLFDVAAKSSHHGRFPLNCSFLRKNRFRQTSEICSIKCQAS
jgi:hypothetical protein